MPLNRRYADRDVRDYPILRDYAGEYLEVYTGDFQYLTEMRARWLLGGNLTDAMVRGVLNCMAGDPRVTLPELPEKVESAYGNVVAFPTPNLESNRRRIKEYDCPLFVNGIYHSHKRMTHQPDSQGRIMRYCSGLYRINRNMFSVKAKIKMPYVVARAGSVIHKVGDAECIWYPKYHELGYRTLPSLVVWGLCPTQGLREPRLIDTLENVPDWRSKHQGDFLPRCKRCFPEGE